jgi:predicted DNA-binding protein with PD1-like motif
MHVSEAQRTRHFLIRFERGEELPTALVRALEGASVRAAWIEGVGSFALAELATLAAGGETANTQRVEGPSEATRVTGRVATGSPLRLWATLARSDENGAMTLVAGELTSALVHALDLHVVALDETPAAREERPAPPQQQQQQQPAPQHHQQTPAYSARPAGEMNSAAGPAMPQKPARPREEQQPESYPEVGDRVTHFHFGECEVIDSDGDRIRLRQERDGRVREVALTMLKIDSPTTDAAGKKHYELRRKN